jgi:hypothetical protein
MLLRSGMRKLLSSQEKQSHAGKKSGTVRADRADKRRQVVKAAFNRLPRACQMQPYSDQAIDALQAECTKLPGRINDDFAEDYDNLVELVSAGYPIKIQVPRETLRKDMIKLGIRSKL